MTILTLHAGPPHGAPPLPHPQTPGLLYRLDRVPYDSAWAIQRTLHGERANDQRPDSLLLLEHDPVYTLGRSTKDRHWSGNETALRSDGAAVYRVTRGGSVTYHGPGQVVGYPILRLRDFCSGPKTYMRLLEEVLIRTLADWGIAGCRIENLPGVWVGHESPAKIAAMGVHISRGVTMHGFALNVSVDLTPFSRIVPCGLENCRVTSMASVLGNPLSIPHVTSALAKHFADVFRIDWSETSRSGLNPFEAVPIDTRQGRGLHSPIEL